MTRMVSPNTLLVKILYFGSSKLDEILNAGRTDKTHFGLRYSGKLGSSQTVFVKASASGVKIDDDLKQNASVGTPVRTPVITQAKRPRADLNEMRNIRRIMICLY